MNVPYSKLPSLRLSTAATPHTSLPFRLPPSALRLLLWTPHPTITITRRKIRPGAGLSVGTVDKGKIVKISGLRLRQLTGVMTHEEPFWEERLIRPIDIYPEHKAQTAADGYWMPQRIDTGRSRVISVFLEIDTDEGVTGLAGPIPHEVAWIIDREFRGLLQGVDPLATERIWDVMFREAVHGRKGATMMAISAIDCALWDLKGRYLDQPVYRLLGGPTRTSAPAYASMLGYSLEPQSSPTAAPRKRWPQGFRALKWFPRWGPTDGREGMARNVELAETLRDAAGPDVDIMLDAWMSWDRPYTLAFARRVEHLDIRWIEEPVMPDKIDSAPRSASSLQFPSPPASTSTPAGVRSCFWTPAPATSCRPTPSGPAVSPKWSRSAPWPRPTTSRSSPMATRCRRMPSCSPPRPSRSCPMLEYLVKWNELLQFFWKEPVKPVDGYITVPDRPGLGCRDRSGQDRIGERAELACRAEHGRQRARAPLAKRGETHDARKSCPAPSRRR